MTFKGKQGKKYLLGEQIGKPGGEGIVYVLQKVPGKVAKVLHAQHRTTARERKLELMLLYKAPPHTAWPEDILYDEDGKFAGYTMPLVENAQELREIYATSPAGGSQQFRIMVAKNLCETVKGLHNIGVVVGDFNPKNILVNQAGNVELIDTDSYHVRHPTNGHINRCVVGLPELLAAELQSKLQNGYTLSSASLPTFTLETDCFALAVLVFQLLINGCHPFSTRTVPVQLTDRQSSVGCPQPVENILNGQSPFFVSMPGLDTPIYAPKSLLTNLSDNVQALFCRAFVDGYTNPKVRPTCDEWISALSLLEYGGDVLPVVTSNAIYCTTCGKQLPKDAVKCPYCAAEAGASVDAGIGNGNGETKPKKRTAFRRKS